MKNHLPWLLLVPLSACASLLGWPEEEQAREFEHRVHLEKGVGCNECHEGIFTAGDEGPLHLPEDQTCYRCHEKPHVASDCRACHGGRQHDTALVDARVHLVFAHDRHLPTVKGNCMRCHQGIADPNERAMPTMGTCLACHAHEDQFETSRCGTCHRDLVAEQARPLSHLAHGPDYVSRHGVEASSQRDLCAACHNDQFCARCHGASVPSLGFQRAFEPNENLRLHKAGFFARHSREAQAQTGTCMTCHSPDSCQACHESRGLAATGALRRGPHPTNWVSATGENAHGPAARLDPMACATCHGGAGEGLCVSCHKVGGVGGSPHPLGWSSEKRLSEAPCRLCHLGGP